jgi:hypothetical protein
METTLELVLSKTILRDEDQFIFIEPVCNFFGIGFRNQQRVIGKDPICQSDSTKKYNELLFRDKRLRLCVGKRAFIRWIQLINAQIVRKDLRELFVQYQVAVFDYLYVGNESKTTQLEDIRKYAENINSAIRVNRQVMEYIAEQKQHRDLCLASSPVDWAQIKNTLVQEKKLPEQTALMISNCAELPDDMEKLMKIKHAVQSNIARNKNVLLYQKQRIQKVENPVPEGFRKEQIKLRIKGQEAELEKICAKIDEINKQLN